MIITKLYFIIFNCLQRRKAYLNICKPVNYMKLGNENSDVESEKCNLNAGVCTTLFGEGKEVSFNEIFYSYLFLRYENFLFSVKIL